MAGEGWKGEVGILRNAHYTFRIYAVEIEQRLNPLESGVIQDSTPALSVAK